MDKKHLETLILEWSEDYYNNPEQARDVLDMLSPNRTLKNLQIYEYPGKEFPKMAWKPCIWKYGLYKTFKLSLFFLTTVGATSVTQKVFKFWVLMH